MASKREFHWMYVEYESLLAEMDKLLRSVKLGVTSDQWKRVLSDAIDPVTRDYKGIAAANADTGNLARAVSKKYIDYSDQVHVMVGGPKYTKPGSDNPRSANHAWLVEYGTRGPRKPGVSKKNTSPALVVRDAVNRKTLMNADDFQAAERGSATFVMGNKRRDFGPVRLGPGDTYGAMPAGRWMADAIQANDAQVKRLLALGIQRMISARSKK